jgi:hypothetical protein
MLFYYTTSVAVNLGGFRTVARDSMEYGKALMAMKMRKVLASL